MMIKPLATIVATLSLLVSTSGCSGMKNFLFGRGAACSSCATASPTYGIATPAEPGCGYEPTCGYEQAPAPFTCLRGNCGMAQGHPTGNQCECGNTTGAYLPSNVDYLGAGINDPYAYGGEVIQAPVIGNGYNGYPVEGQVIPDGMQPRQGTVTQP